MNKVEIQAMQSMTLQIDRLQQENTRLHGDLIEAQTRLKTAIADRAPSRSKIHMIKLVRELTGCDLVTAKNHVDAVWSRP